MEETTPIMPDFRVVYISDGTFIADCIANKYSKEKYKLTVELHNLRDRSTSLSSPSSSSPPSPVEAVGSAGISVLVTSPAMLKYLDNMIETNEDRTWLINLMKADQHSVTLSVLVDELQMKNTIKVFFNNELTWQHLDVGTSSQSYHQSLVELMSMLETWEEMPVPTLKKYHLLSNKPVLAHDTVYIQVEKHLVDLNAVQSLSLIFKNDHQVTATHVTDNLYQFEVPESSESSTTIEVFTSGGESLGIDTIRYRDKLQVFADVYNDILNLAKVQSPHANEEVESMIADWLTSSEKLSSEDEIHKLLAQWAKSIKLNKNDVNLTLPLMPLFVYLCTKFNQNTLAQLLLGHLGQLAKVNSLFKEDSLDEDQENEYENDTSSEFLVVKDEDDAYSSSDAQENYVIPEEIVVENRCHDTYENINGRKETAVSEFIPRTAPHKCAREPLSKSCPPECGKHGHMRADLEKPCYENLPVCGGLEADASKDLTQPQIEASEKPTSLSEIQVSSRAVVNEKPVTGAKDRTVSESSTEDNRPVLPPRRRSDISKQHNTPSSKNLRRLSLACLVPRSTPPSLNMSSSTLNLTRLCDPKPNFYGQHRGDSSVRMLPSKSPSILSSSTLSLPRLCEHARVECSTRFTPVTSPDGNSDAVNTRLPPIPYSCRPSPPIPKTLSRKNSSDGVCSKGHRVARQQSQPAAEEECYYPENISDDNSPDYSEPFNVYLDNGLPNGLMGLDSCYTDQDEVIYERIDETLEIFQEQELIQAAALYDVPRKGIHRSVSADVVPASPQSSVPISPTSPDAPTSQKRSSSRSSPWTSFKLSLRKPGKSKRLNTKL